MFRQRFGARLRFGISSFAVASLIYSCASTNNGLKVDQVQEKELPPDMQQKFEVKDTADAIPIVAPSPSPTPSPVALKRGRSKKKTPLASVPAPQPSVAPSPVPFVYPERRPVKDPIWSGEKTTYEITYFGLSAGDFVAEVMPYQYMDNRKVYHVRGTAVSSRVFDLFYHLNDMVETFFDYDGIFTHRFHILLDETKQTRDSLELFDSEKKQTFFWNRWNRKDQGFKETKKYAPIQPFPQDSFSSIYFLRTVPLPPGAQVKFPVCSEANCWDAMVTVIRREILQTPMGRIQTVVLKPTTGYQGNLKSTAGSDSFMWLTDDDRRILVRLEAKVRIGTVVAVLKKFEPGTEPTSAAETSEKFR